MKLVINYFVVLLTFLSGSVALADPNQDFLRGLNRDDPRAVEAAIIEGADVNNFFNASHYKTDSYDSDFYSALSFACKYRSAEMVKTLLDHGADPHKEFSRSPIESAVMTERSSVEKVRLLLEHNVEVNKRGTSGFTPLHWAAQEGNEEVMELLIQAGAEVHLPDSHVKTPLYHTRGTADTKVLLDSGASMYLVDALNRKSALSSAIEMRHLEKVKTLIKHGADHCLDSSKISDVLTHPVEENIVHILLSAGALRDSNEFGSRSE